MNILYIKNRRLPIENSFIISYYIIFPLKVTFCLQNGSLLRVGDRLLISRRDYCLTAYPVGNRFVINPMNCDAGQKSSANIMLNTISKRKDKGKEKGDSSKEKYDFK